MAELGSYAIALAFAAALWSIVASIVGAVRKRDDIVRSAEGGIYAMALAVTVAAFSLLYVLVTSDFTVQYVVDYTSKALDLPYKIAAMWAGQGGSLLLWTWISAILAAIITVQNRRKGWGVAPYAVTTFAVVSGLFAALVLFIESPFVTLPAAAVDGQGLNPLLQNPLQIIHPLALYGGYILYTVPFALTISALVEGPKVGPWIKVTQRWNALSWIALTLGIVLGARWAYTELGWGGYWGWDPVENASLLPWLTGTALLHTTMTHWKTGRLRLLGFVMVVTTFILCLFGTFLTRSGVISSVHAFGESGLGGVMGGAILAMLLIAGGLIIWRLPMLRAPKSDGRGHGWFGQRTLVVLMVALTVAVLWGTMYPLFLRVLRNQEISVTPEFFRVVCTPLGVLVLAIFAFSPFLPDQTAADRRKEIVIRSVLGGATFLAVWFGTGRQNPGVALVLAVAVLATLTVVRKAIMRVGSSWRESGDSHVLNALRTSGPYVAHIGLIMLLAAVTLNVNLQQNDRVELKVGQSGSAGGQTIKLVKLDATDLTDRTTFVATVDLIGSDGRTVSTIETLQNQFTATGETHAEVGIRAAWNEDVYLVLESADTGTQLATISVFTNPAVVWIWIGGMLLALGGVLFALPRRQGAPRLPLETDHDQPRELVGA